MQEPFKLRLNGKKPSFYVEFIKNSEKNRFSVNIEKDYKRLYQHWRDEFEQIELTPLTKELITYYNNNLSQLKDYKKGPQNSIKDQLVDSYREQFKFLIEDFLKIREVKIINGALALREIDFNNMLEVEKLFYQKLISSLKGFQKMRSFTLYDDLDTEAVKLEIKGPKEDIKKVEKKVDLIKKEVSQEAPTDSLPNKEDIDYILIRFVTKAPPLVGMDFINYGPFEKEDIAFIPLKNAKILISEKFAEPIKLS